MDVFDALSQALCVCCFGGIVIAMLATMIARVFFPSTCEVPQYTQQDAEDEIKADLTTLDTWQEEQAARGIPITDAPPDEMLGPPWA